MVSRLTYRILSVVSMVRHSRRRSCAVLARRRQLRTELRQMIEEEAKVTVDLGGNGTKPRCLTGERRAERFCED